MDLAQYKDLFISEARDHLQALNQAVLTLEQCPTSDEPMERSFRAAHTIKGMAATMGYDEMTHLAHATEDLMDQVRKQAIPVTSDLVNLLFQALDALESQLDAVAEDRDPATEDLGGILVALRAFQPALATESPATRVAEIETVKRDVVAVPPRIARSPGSPPSPMTYPSQGDRGQSVRVNVAHLDRLLNLMGAMVVNKSRLWRIQRRHELPDLKEALEEHDLILMDLQAGVLASRTVPVAQVFNRFPRMVRDLAREGGKEVDLVITGAEIELDRAILQEIGDPLLHLLRNAVDHGLETPAERTAAGKPARGQIRLAAVRHQGMVVITVEDDGRGMDPVVLRRVAVEQGFLTADQAADLTDDAAFALIYRSGFSTAQQVTDVSGRGVGMDVVRRQMESMRGHLEIESQVGQGTRFSLRLPLTLAIIQALLVRVAEEIYAVPLSHVHRTVEVLSDQLQTRQGQPAAALPDELLPLCSLAELVDLPPPDLLAPRDPDDPIYALVVGHDGQHMGLVVDELLGREEIVIKSLSGFLGRIPGLAGATILGEGEIVLILDVVGLLSQA